MTKTKKKLTTLVLSVIMVLTLCIGLVPMFSVNASAAEATTTTVERYVQYELTDSCGESCPGHIYTGGSSESLMSSSIIVKSGVHNITLQDCYIKGHASPGLDIAPGATVYLTVLGTNAIEVESYNKAAIFVPVGATLVITKESTGTLTAKAATTGAGIGGGLYSQMNESNSDYSYLSSGTITINGGTIIAVGGNDSAGIGSAGSTAGTYVGGHTCGDITINGGTVTATGGNSSYPAAGIGGGGKNPGGNITITGGTVTATGGNYDGYGGAGIGSGYGYKMTDFSYGTITITGGTVTATGGGNAAGIGHGSRVGESSGSDAGGTISITGGTVVANSIADSGTVNAIVWNAEKTEATFYGEVLLTADLTINEGQTLNIPEGATLTVGKGVTLTNNGTLNNNGTLTCEEHNLVDGICSNCGLVCQHSYTNGFCTVCGGYEEPKLVNGVYQISNAGQLLWFANYVNSGNYSANAVLTSDIDMTDVTFTPIAPITTLNYSDLNYTETGYLGTFDGGYHTISNLTITRDSTKKATVGLFGTVSGEVKNLHIDKASYTLAEKVDGRFSVLVGQLLPGGKIANCIVSNSTVNNGGQYIAGAVAGCNYGGTISNCLSWNNTISAHTRCGNLVGDNQNDATDTAKKAVGTTTNCYSTSSIAGGNGGTGTVTNSTANIQTDDAAKVVYLLNGSTSTGAWKLKNGIPTFKGDTVYENTCGGDVFYSTTEGNHDAHSIGDDFRCTLCGNYDAPTLVDGYYQIATPSNLFWFAEAVNDGQQTIKAKLTASFNLNNVEWTPIGSLNRHFMGEFDGQGYIIAGLEMNITTKGYYGLFGYASGAKIENFTLYGAINVNVPDGLDGELHIGGVSAEIYNTTITNVHSVVDIKVENTTSYIDTVGGLVGQIYSGDGSAFSKCSYSGAINLGSCTVNCTGGLMGYIMAAKTVSFTDCAFYGSIKSDYETAMQVGGILGYYRGANLTIKNCLSVGTITMPSTTLNGSLVGVLRQHTSANTKIINNYTNSSQPFGNSGETDDITDSYEDQTVEGSVTIVNEVELKSGEVAYLLGSAWGMTSEADGTPKLGSEIAASAQDFIIVGQQLNLGADLSMKYYVYGYSYEETEGKKVKVELDQDMLKMQFTFLGEVTTVTGTLDEDTGYYVFILKGITPQCMDDKINAAVLYYGAETGEALTGYSVVQNLRNLLEKYSDDAALVTLINDTLAYGKAASDYRYYPSFTENYVDSNREIPEAEYTWENGTGDAGEYIYQFAIRFGTMNHVKIRLNKALESGMTLTIDGEAATLIPDTTTDYVSKGIAASDFNKDIVICVMDGTDVVETLTVSVNDLLDIAYKSYLSVDASDAEYEKYNNLATLTKALYNYGVSAHVYARCPKGDHHYVNGVCYCGAAPYTYDETTNTYTVYSAEGLYAWNTAAQADLSTNLILMADITLPNTDLTTGNEITVENGVPSGSNWTPISTDWEKGYIGTFDGNNHTITGLRINTEKNYASLIGTLGADGEVKNLTLANAVVYGTGSSVSGFVAYISGGTISGCTFGSSTTDGSSVSGAGSVGGIIYKNASGLVSYCINNGTISASGTDAEAGGIAAQTTSNGTVSNCINNGSVSVSGGSETTFAEAGGIVGYTKSNSTVSGCINNGFVSVTGVSISAGGIVGWNENSTVSGCENTGDAKGTGSTESLVGGIVGYTVDGTVENNTNTGTPTNNVGNG